MERSRIAREAYAEPTRAELDLIMHYSEKVYKTVRWRIPDDFMSYAHFERVLWGLDGTSSPGYPFCLSHPTIADYFGNSDKMLWREDRKRELYQLLLTIEADLSAYEPMFRVFTKMEPHKPSKVEAGRWRLIFAAPLPFQVLGHMLFAEQREKELVAWDAIPSAYGISMMRGGWKLVRKMLRQYDYLVSADKDSWDLFSPAWVYDLKLELRKALCANLQHRWVVMADWFYRKAYHESLVALTDGTLYRQQIGGVMKSGLPITIDDNSSGQWFVHLLATIRVGAGPELIWAVGDDTVQKRNGVQKNPLYRSELERAGCKIKEIKIDDVPEFVGMAFPETGMVPRYLTKHLAAISHTKQEDLEMTLESIATLYVHSPYYKIWRDLAQLLSVHLRSEASHRAILDHPV